jgi:hypothetical protein
MIASERATSSFEHPERLLGPADLLPLQMPNFACQLGQRANDPSCGRSC